LVCATASGAAAVGQALASLEVDEKAMRANLESLLKDAPRDAFGSAAAMIERALATWRETAS
jgi:hypothetical protein